MAEQYNNLAVSTTAGSINNSTDPVVFSVAAGEGTLFPATTNGSFRVTVSDADGTNAEVMLCTSRSTDALTCSRAANATLETPTPTKIAHTTGSLVSHDLTTGAMNQIRIDKTGTFSGSLPTDSRSGDIRIPTDDIVQWVNTGSSLKPFGPSFNLTAPIPSNFSWTNQGGATNTNRAGSVFLKGTNQSGDQLRIWGTAVPTAPYSYIVGIVPMISGTDFQHVGFGFTDGTKYEHICIQNGNVASPNIAVQKFNTTTSFNARENEIPWVSIGGSLFFLKIQNDTTNVIFSFGQTPYDFSVLFSEAVGTFLGTITKANFVLDGNNTAGGASNTCLVSHISIGS